MSSPSENPLRNLIREIHRRSLWQVLGIYLGGSWLAFEIVERIAESAGLPDWIPPFALILLVIGLPVVLATAYVQEGAPDVTSADSLGELDEVLAGDKPSGSARTPLERLFNWRNALLGGASAFVLLTTVALAWMTFGQEDLAATLGSAIGPSGAEGSVEQSVAVLPFENLSGNPDNEYFSDGITEEVLNALAQIPDLRVPGRTSSFAFKDQNITIQQIADTLDVAHVLEGSVRRSGDRVLITAQLVDARTDTHLWSDAFERQLDDIFAIQREIARAIVDRLQVSLSPEEETRLVRRGTDIPEAHEAYLRGRFLWNQRTQESLQNAIAEFERAIALDSTYTEAYSGLADALMLRDHYVRRPDDLDFRENYERALEAARAAVALDPDSDMARTSLGFALWFVGEWDGAYRELTQAISLNPGYATAQMWYGNLHWSTGRADEGVRHARRAVEIDPVSVTASRLLAESLHAAGRLEEAVEQYRETTRLGPRSWIVWAQLSRVLMHLGNHREALDAWQRALTLGGYDVRTGTEALQAAIRYQETGEPQTFRGFDLQLNTLIWLYSMAGQRDRAVALLDEGYIQEGVYGLTAANDAWDSFGGLDAHPRYQALLDGAGITW